MQQNQRRSVEWLVVGEGAAVLSHALTKVSGTLEKHSFKFVNTRANLGKLLQDLGQRKAQLPGEFLDYSRDRIALLSIAQNSSEVTAQMEHQLPKKTGYDRVSHRYLTGYFHALGENGNAHAILAKAASIKGSTTTFIEAITLSHKRLR